ncbi:MAG: hypothetical protein KOO62_06845 [candidate division Zixibacteria bacterium]|nr:hypothetical protein [candidate division Zixibacteria bacterium]
MQLPSLTRLGGRWQFVIRFVIFFTLAFIIWTVSVPVTNAVTTFCAEKIVLLLDTNGFTHSMDTKNHNIILRYAPTPDGKPWLYNYRNLTFNTVFLIALIMAVPRTKLQVRLKILAWGLAAIFCIHVLREVITVFNYYGQHIQRHGETVYPTFWRKGLFYTERTLARLDGQIIPVAIWAALYFYYQWHREYFKRNA